MSKVGFRLAVDIGGTFTDGVAEIVASGELVVAKRLTTHADPGIAVLQVTEDLLRDMRELERARGVEFECGEVVHGTTLVTNAIIERDGAKVALFATAGTRDVLKMGRETRYTLYDLNIEFPKPLIPTEMIFEVEARMDATGRVLTPLDHAAVREQVHEMKEAGVEAIAVSLLHGYLNAEHEREIGQIIAELHPDAKVSLSSRVASEIGEFERTSTCVANAYVQPLAADYLRRLKKRLAESGIRAPLRIMTSNGGFTSSDAAAEAPIELLESGPAGGVRSAINTANAIGIDDVLTFDMGGTTAKACVCQNGLPELTYRFEAARVARFRKGSGLPILVASTDLIEIGAGGGSIAHRNNMGLLNVGPQSASSEPGPACYGLGGEQPTVTDADLMLGFLDPDWFLGGEMTLDKGAAERAIAALAGHLGIEPLETAWGIHSVVSENMASAARVHAAEKGLDPRKLTLVATGGAGPVHAVEVAAKLGMKRIIFTIAAGVGSCLGFLAAPARIDRAWSYIARVDKIDVEKVGRALAALKEDIREDMARSRADADSTVWSLGVEMRYAGQGHAIMIALPDTGFARAGIPDLVQAFERSYEETYGARIPDGVPQVVTWRLSAQSEAKSRAFKLADLEREKRRVDQPDRQRRVFLPLENELGDVPVHQRYQIRPGAKLRGPLIMTEAESTIVVARPADVEVLDDGTVSVALD
ncbi:MAG: hydantoinase/oxoprolinase family protein [Roseovarius sp.]|nr:hydantoinase/oxoprolinase family protein [Roseovarius sp.]MCY4207164.1 hydantoinase/oxoprolinase family protein [Roseovarius sp.]